MNRFPDDDAGALPDALRWQLRALRRDELPANDLWPAVAARLHPHAPSASRDARGRAPWLGLAASMLLVVGLVGLWRSPAATDPAQTTTLREAERLARHYEAALDSIPATPRSRAIDVAIAELDGSAREIRRALSMDPDSRLLLDQLQRTYARRLALSQRVLHG